MKKKILYCLAVSYIIFLAAPMAFAVSGTGDGSFILPRYSKRISLDFKDADIKDVLKVFSRQIQANFVLSDKVSAKAVTVLLENVPVEEALSAVLIANGLVYRYDADTNIFFVDLKDETEKIVTRVYPLKYASVPPSKILTTFAVTEEEGGAAAATTSATGGSGSITDAITSVLSKDGKISVDVRTNSLVITDVEDNFTEIEKTLAKLDVPVPQVLIQVEMIDTSKSALDQMGVKFGNTLYNINGLGGRNFFFPLSNNVLTKAGDVAQAEYTSGVFSGTNFSAVLQFLTSRTDTKSLARPKLLTLDNQTAQIKISSDQVVSVTQTASTEGQTIEVERMETGVILTVTPQVNLLSRDIMLAVSPKVVDVKRSTLGNYMDPETRGAKVMMRVHDGDTLVLGGLFRSSKDTQVIKIPILGDIPFIGKIFRHKEETDQNRELLIFITPHIMVGEGSGLSEASSRVDLGKRETSLSGRSQQIESELDRAVEHKNLR